MNNNKILCNNISIDTEIEDVKNKNSIVENYQKFLGNAHQDNEYIKDVPMTLPNGAKVTLDDFTSNINNNFLVCGASGSFKTSNVIVPAILERATSMIICDPKGALFKRYHNYLQMTGTHMVYKISFSNPTSSFHYNPLAFIETTQDIVKISKAIINNNGFNSHDPFWEDSAQILVSSIIGLLLETKEYRKKEPNLLNVLDYLRRFKHAHNSIPLEVAKRAFNYNNEFDNESVDGKEILSLLANDDLSLDEAMRVYAQINPNSWATQQFATFANLGDRTLSCVIATAISKLATFDSLEMREMLSTNEINFKSIGKQPSALFVEVSDTDKSCQALINIFFTQAFAQLCEYADSRQDNRLPCPVSFLLDDFPSIHIPDFEVMISNIRSRKISVILSIQSFGQLETSFGNNSKTIIDNCDTLIFTGTNSVETAQWIATKANKSLETILYMPKGYSWIFRRGNKPIFDKNFDFTEYLEKNSKLQQINHIMQHQDEMMKEIIDTLSDLAHDN